MEPQENPRSELSERLASFPTLFQLEIPRVSRRHHKMNVSKLIREERDDPKEFYENANAENLLAFLLLKYMNDLERAKRHIDSVLEKYTDNVVALGNICGYYLQIEDLTEAENILDRIGKLLNAQEDCKGAERKALALAEQAYSLTRLGPKCHTLGILKSREALKEGFEKVSVELNYGLALILERSLDPLNYMDNKCFDPIAYYTEARRCLDIVICSGKIEFCGKGLVLLGDIYKKMNRIPEKYFVTGQKPELFNDDTINECFDRAKLAAPDDHFVLERVGRHYRLCRHFDKAIECLQKANELCPMPLPCHHLGLVYMATANEHANKGQKSKDLQDEARKWLEEADRLAERAAYRIIADLAKAYVKLEEYEKALQCFKRAAEENAATDDGMSLFAAYNYENWGMCFIQLGKMEEGKTKLLKAVECAARVKFHQKTAFSELVKLMQMDERDRCKVKIDKLNELAKLHELVSRHGKALNLRMLALKLDPFDPKTLLGLIENCCKLENYTLARVFLSFLLNLTDIRPPKELILQVNLNAVTVTEPRLAIDIFQETFKFIFPQDCTSDVFIYSADEDKDIAGTLTRDCEEYFSLTCWCPHRDLHRTMHKISETVEALNDSVLIVFVVSKCMTKTGMADYFIERAIENVHSRGYGNIISITIDIGTIIPRLLRDFPTYSYSDITPTEDNMALPLFKALIEMKK